MRGHTSGRHDGAARALRNGSTLEHHIELICQRCRACERCRVFEHRFALAGQRRFLHAQGRRLDQSCVRPNRVTLGEHQYVAQHKVNTRHASHLSVAQHRRGDFGHFGECCHRLRRFALLHIADCGVDQHHHGNHHRVNRPADAALDDPRAEGDGNRGQQQVNQRILKMRQHAAPACHGRCSAQLVGAVRGQPA